MKIDKLSGPLYKHLGHFSQERWVREGHNLMEWVDEMMGTAYDPNKVDPKLEAARKEKREKIEADARSPVYRSEDTEKGKAGEGKAPPMGKK